MADHPKEEGANKLLREQKLIEDSINRPVKLMPCYFEDCDYVCKIKHTSKDVFIHYHACESDDLLKRAFIYSLFTDLWPLLTSVQRHAIAKHIQINN